MNMRRKKFKASIQATRSWTRLAFRKEFSNDKNRRMTNRSKTKNGMNTIQSLPSIPSPAYSIHSPVSSVLRMTPSMTPSMLTKILVSQKGATIKINIKTKRGGANRKCQSPITPFWVVLLPIAPFRSVSSNEHWSDCAEKDSDQDHVSILLNKNVYFISVLTRKRVHDVDEKLLKVCLLTIQIKK